MDIENLKDLKDFIKQNESKINEAAAKIKPFDSVKPGDKAEVLGDTAKWSVIDKAKGKDYAKVLKKYDNSGVVSDMMKNHTDHGLTKKNSKRCLLLQSNLLEEKQKFIHTKLTQHSFLHK